MAWKIFRVSLADSWMHKYMLLVLICLLHTFLHTKLSEASAAFSVWFIGV